MKSFLILSALFILSSCSSLLPQRDSKIKENQCYVKWKSFENRQKYQLAIGKTRHQMETEDLLMDAGANGGMFVRSKISDNLYAVIFDVSDPHATQIVDRITESFFAEVDPRAKNDLRGSTFKIKGYELDTMLKDYEAVDCQNYMATQRM